MNELDKPKYILSQKEMDILAEALKVSREELSEGYLVVDEIPNIQPPKD